MFRNKRHKYHILLLYGANMSVDLGHIQVNQNYGYLNQSGFKTCNNFRLPHLELALKSLAKLHSSYLVHTNLKGFQELNKCCYKEKCLEEGYKKLREILVITPDSDIGKRLSVLVEEVRESLKWQEGVLNVFCHGDLRAGNILFRFVAKGK